MLKELLLQFIVALAPAFAFQLFMYKNRLTNRASIFIALVSCGSLVICMLSAPSLSGYEIDFRFVPFMIGSLYGGIRGLVLLSIAYVAASIPLNNTLWESLSGNIIVVIIIFLLYIAIGPFNRVSSSRKERIGVAFIAFCMLLCSLSFYGYLASIHIEISFQIVIISILAVFGTILAAWLSIYMIEIVKEKQKLHNEVLRVSDNYHNEVVKLQQFIDETTSAVLIVDRKGRITHINDRALELLPIKTHYNNIDGILGVSVAAVFKPGEGADYVTHIQGALKGAKAMLIPSTVEDMTLMHTSFALRNSSNNQIAGAAMITYDVTEITKLRDEVGRMDRLSLVGQMAASITHEIRNPMAVVRGFVQLMKERSPEHQHDYYRIVMEELDRANSIISDFLSLAQNRVLMMEMYSLHDIINDLLPLLHADANMRGQTIEVDLCQSMPKMMLNPREIKQMLLNIARNGMEAMDDKGLLRISTSVESNKVIIRIADTGMGIQPDKMKHLFEPFYTTKTQGTGLGLPLCLSIAERHNGRIDVDTREGFGTVFIVSFRITAS